jgi:hypothetical protein
MKKSELDYVGTIFHTDKNFGQVTGMATSFPTSKTAPSDFNLVIYT